MNDPDRHLIARARLRLPSSVVQAIVLIAIAISVWLAYRPGLAGPFVFDDVEHITRNMAVAIDSLTADNLLAAAFSRPDAALGRPVPMASFALNYFLAERSFDPVGYKITNVAIHIINTMLVFFLARTLFRLRPFTRAPGGPLASNPRAALAAGFVSALWALHPLQLTSVLYTVQRMTSLSAFFMLLGLVAFILGRRALETRPVRGFTQMALALLLGVGLGVLCKENAILLPVLAATVEIMFFSRRDLAARTRRALAGFYLLTVVMPVLSGILYLSVNPDFVLNTYVMRRFDLVERVLTEFRVLFFYVSLLVYPALSRFGLFHDDFAVSSGLWSPPSTLLAVVGGLLVIAVVAAGLLRRRAVWAFGAAWFLVGHGLESTIIGLELVHEHRNYLPSFGLFFVAVYYVMSLIEKVKLNPRLIAVLSLCAVLVLGFVTHTRAQAWSSRALLFETLVRHHPTSYRALTNHAFNLYLQERDIREIYKVLTSAAQHNPDIVHPFIEMAAMLQQMIAVSGRVASDVPVPEFDPSTPAWAAAPVLDREYLLKMDRALTQEVTRRIERGGIHSETAIALWSAQQCIIDGHERCLPLSNRVLQWHQLALQKLPEKVRRRARLELSAAKLHAARGDIHTAIAYVDNSIETVSGDPRYRAQKALLHLALGEIEEAERIAEDIERKMSWRRTHIHDLRILRSAIARAKAGRASLSP